MQSARQEASQEDAVVTILACTHPINLKGLFCRNRFILVLPMKASLRIEEEGTKLCVRLYCYLKSNDGRIVGGPCLCGRLNPLKSSLFLLMLH